MDDARVLALAENALRHWGGGTVVRLIANRENAVCEVRLNDGIHAALRLHRAGYQTDAAIGSELIWTDHLASLGFPCPRPIRTTDGALLAEPAFGPRASAVTWIEAPAIGATGVAWPGSADQHCCLYHALGQHIARMHRLSDTLTPPPGFERPDWGIDGLTGDLPLWGQFWNNPSLDASESDLLQRACNAARATLQSGTWDTGLIHADLLQENILGTADNLHIIDFDDGGTGLRLYDLGTAMVQHTQTPHRADLEAALCDGYGTGHGSLALFTLLRALASAGWVMPRLAPDDPRQRGYAGRALTLARSFLS